MLAMEGDAAKMVHEYWSGVVEGNGYRTATAGSQLLSRGMVVEAGEKRCRHPAAGALALCFEH